MNLFSRSIGLNRLIWRKGSYIALLIALILSSCAPANQPNSTVVPLVQTPSPTPLKKKTQSPTPETQATPSTKGQVIPAQPTHTPSTPGNTAGPNSDFSRFINTKPSKQDLHAYFWKQYLKAVTGSPNGQLFKLLKPAPNPVRKPHAGTGMWNGSSSSGDQFASWRPSLYGDAANNQSIVASSQGASAGQTFTVTTLADTDDGVCDSNCSLREAIYAANDSAGPATITFDVSGTISLDSPPPYILNKAGVTINGAGQQVIVHGYNPASASNDFSKASFTTDGLADSGSDCDPYFSEGALDVSNITVVGCQIQSLGALTITGSTLIDSPAYSQTTLTISGSSSTGGGDYSLGAQTITDSTFSHSQDHIGSGTMLDIENSSFTQSPVYSWGAQTITDKSTFSDSPIWSYATLDIENSSFTGNSWNWSDEAQTITGSTFTGGSSTSSDSNAGSGTTLDVEKSSFTGFAYPYSAGALTITDSTLSGDDDNPGSPDMVTIANNTFSTFSGGFLDVYSGSTLTSTNNTFLGASDQDTFSGNSYIGGRDLISTDSNFSNITVYSRDALTSTNSTFVRTSVSIAGTGTISSDDAVTIANNTFATGNINETSSGGIFSEDIQTPPHSAIFDSLVTSGNSLTISSRGRLTSINNTFSGSGNRINGAAGLYLYNTILANGSTCAEEVTDGKNNLIEASGSQACGLTNGINGNIVGVQAGLGGLVGGVYPAYFVLNAGSSAIDAGDNSICAAPPVNNTSQNGLTRPQGPKCDIGSYEAPPFDPLTEIYLGSVATLGDIKKAIEQIAKDNGYTVSSVTCTQGNCGDPINTRTGAFSFSTPDISIPTSAGNLVFQRTYSSGAVNEFTLPLGYGWTDNQSAHLIFPTDPDGMQGYILFQDTLGNRNLFKINGDGSYSPGPGVLASLTASGSTYTVTTPEQAKFNFDANGKITSMSDPQGHLIQYAYDSQGKLTEVAADGGTRYLSLSYDDQGRIVSVSDYTGRSATFSYDANGNLASSTDLLGRTWTYTYDSLHHLTQITDPSGAQTVHTNYDSSGRAYQQFDSKGNLMTQVVYNADGTATITDANGNTQTHAYDNRGVNTEAVDGLGRKTDTVYAPDFRPTSITNAAGQTLAMEWSADGVDLLSKTDPAGNKTVNTYDNLHNLISTTDPLGNVTSYTYQGKLLMSKTDASGGKTTYTYTADGLLASETDPSGQTTSYIYDSHGQKTSMTDTLGNTTRYTYDSLGRLTDTVDSRQRDTHNAYDAAGELLNTITNYDPSRTQNDQSLYNIVTSYQYDTHGNQIASTDTYGRTTHYTYDDEGHLITTTDALGNVTTNTYNADGQLVSTKDALGRTTTYTYDAAGRQLTTIDALGNSSGTTTFDIPDNTATASDALGHTAKYYYDSLERVVKVVDALGDTTTTTYDVNGNVASRTDALGRTTSYVYDTLNRLVTTNGPDGSTTTVYDPATGNKIATIDALQHRTTYTYDSDGRLIATTDPLNRTTRTEYDQYGRRTASVDAAGNRTKYGYDLLDRLVATTDPAGKTTTTTYDALGRVLATTDQNGHTTWSSYDALGHVLTTTDANGKVTKNTYDAVGNLLSTEDALEHTATYTYDVLNRRVAVTDPLQKTTHTSYDALGNITDQTDANGVVTHTTYDALSRPVTVLQNYRPGVQSDAQTNVETDYTYNAVGNRVAVKDPDGHVTTFGYDASNRVISKIDPLQNKWTYTYDANGNQLSTINANGKTINYTYDLGNQLTGIQYPAPDAPVSFTYTPTGQRKTMSDGLGTTTWSYDNLGRLIAVTDPNGKTVKYGYDAAGNRTGLTYPDTKQVTYTYDPANRLAQIADWSGQQTKYGYDAVGHLLNILRPNNVNSDYTDDVAGHLTQLNHATGGTNLATYGYTYDANGNITQAVENMQTIVGPTVQVTVTDTTGAPLSGKTVYAFNGTTYTGYSKVTDANGQVSITLPAGSYRFRADVDGTQFWSASQNNCTIGQCASAMITVPQPILVSVQSTDGTPMSGLSVYAFDGTTYTNYSGKTDANGQVSLRLPPGNYRFRTDFNGTQFWDNSQDDCTVPGCTLASVAVTQPVTVSVLDNLSMPHAGIAVYAFNGATYSGISGTTDANGQVSLTLPAGSYHFRADFNGTQFWDSTQNDCTIPGCVQAAVAINLPVQVTVQDTSGTPMSGLSVYAYNGTTYSGITGKTDVNGQVSLTLPAGGYRFRADFNRTQFWDSAQNDCTIPGCTTAAVTVTNGVLVTVQNTDGAPQSGLKVYAYNGSTYTGYSGTTSASGQVTMTLPQGSYRFRADLNGTQFWDSAQNDCTIPGCGSSSITVTKPMTVTVQDTDGNSKSGLNVYAFTGTLYDSYAGVTNASGQATFTLPQGGYRFRADLNGTQFWSSSANDCTLPGCSADQVTVTKPVTVTIQNAGGTPQSGVKVYAFNAATYSGYSGTSDANGNVIFTLPQGSYRFRADFNGKQYWSSSSNDCTLPGCATDLFVVGPSTATATATAYATNTSTPVPSVTPSPVLTNTSAPAPSSTPTPASTNTPAPSSTPLPAPTNTALPTNTSAPTSTQSGFAVQNQGALNIVPQSGFVQAVYKPGSSHRILADQSTGTPAPASTPTANSTAVPPTNTPGTTPTPAPTLTATSSAPSKVSITVQDTNNAPKSGLKVYVFNSTTYTGHSGTTDSNGQVVFTLPQGSYRFRADLNGTHFWSSGSNDCTLPNCTTDSITVTLPVTITVKDTNGAVQSGLHLYAFNLSTYTGYSAVSDSNGTAIFTLPQGSYRFRADFNGTQFWSNAQPALGSPGNDCSIPGCTSDAITVTLPVTITVKDTDGTVKSGLPVYAFAGTTYTGYKSTTDSNGQVSLTLPQGSYRFRADLNGTQFWSSATNTCTLPGCTTASITVTKPLILTVQGQTGQPYPNLSVYAFSVNPSTGSGQAYTGYNGTTDTSGHVTFTLPEGSYRFRADLNGTQFWSSPQNDCTMPGCTTATVTLPISMAQQAVTINYTYDALNRLTSANYSDPNNPGAGGNAFAYVYDAAGNVLQYTQTTGTMTVTTTYTYDSANQLATAQLGSASAVNYTYDADGNLLSNGVNHYAYDSADRLISVTNTSGTVTMAYDGLGQRLSMSAAGVTTQYVLDSGQVLEATSGGKTTAYLYGMGPVGQQTDSWAYDLSDGTNTPRQLVSAQGQITFSARYTPWGDTLQSSGTGNFTYGYLGGVMDTSTGLLYVGSGQYYDSQTGRFLSRNAKPDQTNPYVPWGGEPTGALFAPLALLFMFYSRRKKRGTLDVIIILLVLGVALGLGVSACGPSYTIHTQNGSTATVVLTPVSTSTPATTYTATVTIATPTGTPTETPSATCTASVTPTQTPIDEGAALTSGYYIPTEAMAEKVDGPNTIPIPASASSTGSPYLSTTPGKYNYLDHAQYANEGFLYDYTYTCLQGSGQLKSGQYVTCQNPNGLKWTGMADQNTRKSVTFLWANMDLINKLVNNPFKTAAVCNPSYTQEKIQLTGSDVQAYLASHGNPDATLDVVDRGDELCSRNNQDKKFYIDIFTGVGENALNYTVPLFHKPVEVYIVSHSAD